MKIIKKVTSDIFFQPYKQNITMYDRWKIFFFDQPVQNDLRTYVPIQKIATDQGDDYTTGCLLDYPYFEKYYKLIAIKQTTKTRC